MKRVSQSACAGCALLLAAAGGGEVVFTRGRYLCGSLALASDVTLVVTPQATILGSTNLADYTTGRLIGADGATNVCIRGGGRIDGQGEHFWMRRDEPYRGPSWRGTAQFNYRALKRPRFIHLRRCRGVIVRDVTLTGSPSWTLHLERCVTALVERVTIRNPLHGPNTDGIDINSCQDVHVRDCDIITGDDGVVLKSPARDRADGRVCRCVRTGPRCKAHARLR